MYAIPRGIIAMLSPLPKLFDCGPSDVKFVFPDPDRTSPMLRHMKKIGKVLVHKFKNSNVWSSRKTSYLKYAAVESADGEPLLKAHLQAERLTRCIRLQGPPTADKPLDEVTHKKQHKQVTNNTSTKNKHKRRPGVVKTRLQRGSSSMQQWQRTRPPG